MKQRDLSVLVMQEIKQRDIQMLPGYYFTLLAWLKRIGLVLAIGATAYMVGLIIFKFRFYDPLGYLAFGLLGFRGFIQSIPWHIIAMTAVVVGLSSVLLRQYEMTYRQGYLPVFGAFMAVVLFFGVVSDKTKIHEEMRYNDRIPLFYHGIFYDPYWVMGRVLEVDEEHKQLLIITPNHEKMRIFWNDTTLMPSGTKITIDDIVQAVGQEEEHQTQDEESEERFNAQGIVISKTAESLKWLFVN